MPRFATPDEVTLTMPLLRLYLKRSGAAVGEHVVHDAFALQDPGALQLLDVALQLRGNRRTRRRRVTVLAEWRRVNRMAGAVPARWYVMLCEGVMALFRVMRRLAYPREPVRSAGRDVHAPRALRRALSRKLCAVNESCGGGK